MYVGSDSAGVVSFRLHAVRRTGAHPQAKLWIGDFQFANRCAGTTMIKKMSIGPHYSFGTGGRSGSIVVGAVHRDLTGDLFAPTPPGYGTGETGVARGIARVRTTRCDSGKLRFAATWSSG